MDRIYDLGKNVIVVVLMPFIDVNTILHNSKKIKKNTGISVSLDLAYDQRVIKTKKVVGFKKIQDRK